MLHQPQLAIDFMLLAILPIAFYTLARGGNTVPREGRIARYFQAQAHLQFAINVFICAMCVQAALELAMHFNVLTPPAIVGRLIMQKALSTFAAIGMLGLWGVALWKVHVRG